MRDLRKKPPAPAPSAKSQINQLPLMSGVRRSLTPMEKQFLEKAGWKEGEPIPMVADEVAKLQTGGDDVDISGKAAVPPSAKDMVNFDSLTQSHQNAIADAVQRAREQSKHIDDNNPLRSIAGVPGGAAAAQAIEGPGIEIIRPTAAPAAAPPSEPEEDRPTTSPTGALQGPTHCPHCRWDLAVADEEPAIEDKRMYMVHFRTGKRFIKTYDMLGGAVRVTFRTLTTAEADAALSQVAYDARDGKLPNEAEMFRQNINYRLCLGLAAITGVDTPFVADEDPLAVEWDKPGPDEPPQTALPVLLEYTYANALANESLRRVVGLAFQRFQRMLEKMEANIANADFWQGIGSAA